MIRAAVAADGSVATVQDFTRIGSRRRPRSLGAVAAHLGAFGALPGHLICRLQLPVQGLPREKRAQGDGNQDDAQEYQIKHRASVGDMPSVCHCRKRQ
jgi:hypothetical protein